MKSNKKWSMLTLIMMVYYFIHYEYSRAVNPRHYP